MSVTIPADTYPIEKEKLREVEAALFKELGVLRLSSLKIEGPRDYYVEDTFACGSLAVIGGKTGSGKSFVNKCLLAETVRDRPGDWFGWKVKKGSAIWIGFEEDAYSARVPFEQMGLTQSEMDRIILLDYKSDKWSLGNLGKAIRDLDRLIKHAHSTGDDAVVAVLDPVIDLTTIKDINVAYTDLRHAMLELWKLGHRTGTCILGLVHTGKGDRRGVDALTGNSGFATPIDRALLLRGEDDDTRYLSSIKLRGTYGRPFKEFQVLYDPDIHNVSRGPDLAGEQRIDIRKEVLRILDTLAPGARINQTPLLVKVGCNRDAGRKVLEEMEREKIISRRGSRPKQYCRAPSTPTQNRSSDDVRPAFISNVVGRNSSGNVSLDKSNISSDDVRPGAVVGPDAKGPRPDVIAINGHRRIPLPHGFSARVDLEVALAPPRKRVLHDEVVD